MSDKIRNVFGSDPTKQPVISLRTEKARKIGRLVEDRSHRSLTKKVESAFVRTALKPNKQKGTHTPKIFSILFKVLGVRIKQPRKGYGIFK